MRLRRLTVTAGLTILIAGALAGAWRSVAAGDDDPARRLAAGLRCPACQGESVADSRSPIAAAMREVIAGQLREGRSPDEIRGYLVDRYGTEVLAAPAARGWGLLLWTAPALALTGLVVPAGYARLRSRRPGAAAFGRRTPGRRAGPGRRDRQMSDHGGRLWGAGAVVVLALVGAVALAAPPGHRAAHPAAPPSPGTADPTADQLILARSLESQGHYATAAQVYRTVLEQRPSAEVRLRLAFTLIRLGQATEAARLAEEVLTDRPDTPDGLLILGLAQRRSDPESASATLRRFLVRAPEHPAAAEVRRLLRTG
ncbi:cytochrome c-type biogenesis protein CcmH [Plantactinospora sp. WMMC1484]|uniref:cytochrome c-type biogenesis protein CcmH n=1 Tax=Plantactinospora sp. WMMC1484 TaxID=3404122 RepID=UPI003BF47737